METLSLTTIKKEIMVEASQQTAFEVFTQKMNLWWPEAGHTEDCPMVKVGLEPKTGGRWYGINADGGERELGRVLIYDPYAVFALDWQLNAEMKYDAELHTEVRVQFIPEGPGSTLVKLEHHDLHRLVESEIIAGINDGWENIMQTYQEFAHSFTTSITVDGPPETVFKKLADVAKWWTKEFEGKSEKLGDEFIICHPGAHYSKQRLTEVVPGEKLVWLVTDSRLDWLENGKTEWTGTRMIFELTPKNNQTVLTFTHEGLVPGKASYDRCFQGWTMIITDWLYHYITENKSR